MSTEIHNQTTGWNLPGFSPFADHPTGKEISKAPLEKGTENKVPAPEIGLKNLHTYIQKIIDEMSQKGFVANRRLDFKINEELGQVVVRIINNDTGKVIVELPPEQLQHLHMRIKEMMGILIDEKI
jgi:flagellar protein FlaG